MNARERPITTLFVVDAARPADRHPAYPRPAARGGGMSVQPVLPMPPDGAATAWQRHLVGRRRRAASRRPPTPGGMARRRWSSADQVAAAGWRAGAAGQRCAVAGVRPRARAGRRAWRIAAREMPDGGTAHRCALPRRGRAWAALHRDRRDRPAGSSRADRPDRPKGDITLETAPG